MVEDGTDRTDRTDRTNETNGKDGKYASRAPGLSGGPVERIATERLRLLVLLAGTSVNPNFYQLSASPLPPTDFAGFVGYDLASGY